MRRLRYSVAASLDGFIAGPNGEFDWIPMDPEIDFAAMFARYDTLLLGRKSYEATVNHPDGLSLWSHLRLIVCSRTLAGVSGAEVWSDDVAARVAALKQEPGQDLWLFGGGELFRTLLAAGVVDDIEVAIVPVLLGGGIPMRALPAERTALALTDSRLYAQSGIMLLTYAVRAA